MISLPEISACYQVVKCGTVFLRTFPKQITSQDGVQNAVVPWVHLCKGNFETGLKERVG